MTSETDKSTEGFPATAEVSSIAGRYSNHIQMSYQQEEFILDFFARGPGQNAHVARIFLHPGHAKRLAAVLQGLLEKYDATYGQQTPEAMATPVRKRASKRKLGRKRASGR
ncbi:MAG: DUF3467 domain-containing protein [Armatimonadetes bacterium]|nr:DUF3467 domain-containing protein [Armatimonadota bacterium]